MSNLHNELKRANLHSLALRRMFGGDHLLSVERLSETLQPVINPYEHPYCAWLREEYLWAATVAVSAVAGEYSLAAIANPANSGLLVLVEGASVQGNSAVNCRSGRAAESVISATASSATCIALDSRKTGGRVRTLVYSGTDTALLSASQVAFEVIEAGTADFYPALALPAILQPGQSYWVQFETVNVGGFFNFFGTERDALPGELNP